MKNLRPLGILCLLLAFCLLASCSAPRSTPKNEDPATLPRASSAPSAAGEPPLYESDYPGESYLSITENESAQTSENSMLTFSLKVDTASYTNVERYVESGSLPPADAVRIEELINYFSYDADMSFNGDSPFSIYAEVAPSPFDADKYMAFIRVKTEDIDKENLPGSNLTFLIDTSGSMDSYDKLPLLKTAFSLLAETLDEDDRVSIVTYAGSSSVALDSASGGETRKILNAIENLSAGGSTAGAEGIQTAYKLARKNFMEGGNNRVILATDGDFNVGISDINELEKLISEERDGGVYLSVLGFGTGNIRDDIMETLAKNGNGNYSYINSVATAEKVLVDEMGANLFTVANDVKAQVEFNPQNVRSYRLIGYENRMLDNRDFADDTKDAGEIGAGTDVVIMFELELGSEPGLKYGGGQASDTEYADELFEVRIRYKDPGRTKSKELVLPVTFGGVTRSPSPDFNFACAVAGFGLLLRDSQYKGSADIRGVTALAEDSLGRDEKGYRRDFLSLLGKYGRIAG